MIVNRRNWLIAIGAGLSAAGAARLWAQGKSAVAYPAPEGRKWPLEITARNTEIKSLSADNGVWRYQTEHFMLESDVALTASSLRELARLLEAAWMASCVLPFNWQPHLQEGQTSYLIQFFSLTDAYYAAGGARGTAAVYRADKARILVPLESLHGKSSGLRTRIDQRSATLRTLVHEATHQLMHPWLGNLPIWLAEGAADYVAAAKYEAGTLHFKNHATQVVRRIHHYLKDVQMPMWPDLEKFMALTPKAWQAEVKAGRAAVLYAMGLALTAYFCHGDAKIAEQAPIFEFIEAIRLGQPYLRPLAEKLQQGRDGTALQKALHGYFAPLGLDFLNQR